MRYFCCWMLWAGLSIALLPGQGTSVTTIQASDLSQHADVNGALSPGQVEALKEKILEKVNLLTNYLAIIADKRRDMELRNQAVGQAVNLFLDENQIVEVSSVTRTDVQQIPVRLYFRRLQTLPYHEVRVTFYEVATLSALERRPDGRWSATATIFQRFEGYGGDGELKYKDRTVKVIEVIIEQEVVRIGSRTHYIPAVRLGNIRVKETKA